MMPESDKNLGDMVLKEVIETASESVLNISLYTFPRLDRESMPVS